VKIKVSARGLVTNSPVVRASSLPNGKKLVAMREDASRAAVRKTEKWSREERLKDRPIERNVA
jgi:hypothetical protein